MLLCWFLVFIDEITNYLTIFPTFPYFVRRNTCTHIILYVRIYLVYFTLHTSWIRSTWPDPSRSMETRQSWTRDISLKMAIERLKWRDTRLIGYLIRYEIRELFRFLFIYLGVRPNVWFDFMPTTRHASVILTWHVKVTVTYCDRRTTVSLLRIKSQNAILCECYVRWIFIFSSDYIWFLWTASYF